MASGASPMYVQDHAGSSGEPELKVNCLICR